MKRVLITGATGFIGRHCLPVLAVRGYEIHATSSKVPEDFPPDVTDHQVDLLDGKQVCKVIARVQPTHLIHLAWHPVRGDYRNAPENFQWVQASLELLRRFQEQGGQRIVMAGSCFEYDWTYGYCSEFLTPSTPDSFYGQCKHALQLVLEGYAQVTGLSSAWGRIFLVYGPHEHPARLVSSVIGSLLRQEPALCSHGEQIRDYLHVEDVADAFVALLESDVTGPVNIGSGRPIALKDVIDTIAEKLDRRDLVRLGTRPPAPNDTHLVVADVSRLFEEVGWQPTYDLDGGLAQTIDWWKHQLNLHGT